MEATLELVQKHCHLQMKLYADCIERNGQSYTSTCEAQRKALTRCAEDNVEALKRVKERCVMQVEAFKECTSRNDPSECVNEMESLYNCHKINS